MVPQEMQLNAARFLEESSVLGSYNFKLKPAQQDTIFTRFVIKFELKNCHLVKKIECDFDSDFEAQHTLLISNWPEGRGFLIFPGHVNTGYGVR